MKVVLPLLCILMVASNVLAQDEPKVGLTMGYPTSVGVIWEITDRVALRPEFSVSHSSGDSQADDLAGGAPLSQTSTNAVGPGISALFYLGRLDAVRTYVSPRFAYARTSTSASTDATGLSGPATAESTVSSYSTSGSFGAQYAAGRHFGLFGEIGLSYSRTTTSQTSVFTTSVTAVAGGVVTQSTRTQTIQSSSHSNTVSTRSAVGVIFYF